jgi:hypothetical protein
MPGINLNRWLKPERKRHGAFAWGWRLSRPLGSALLIWAAIVTAINTA